jgi:cytochrome c556
MVRANARGICSWREGQEPEWEEASMIRWVVAVGAVLLGITAVMAQQDIAKQQDDLMRTTIGRPFYGVLLKMTRGQIPYDQAAVDAALAELEKAVPTIPATFQTNPKMDLPGAEYISSPKVWENKADFDSKVPAVVKQITDLKGTIKDVEVLKTAWKQINDKCDGCHDTYRIHLKKK